jgi:D-sedoheptulose 7-phosphate isomerase
MSDDARAAHVVRVLGDAAAAHERLAAADVSAIVHAAVTISAALKQGGKVLTFGNGGSAADAQHFAAELVGRYERPRLGWPAIALSSDPSVVTALGNDYGFDQVFARQIAALGSRGDVALGVTTSGSSPNVLRAFETAHAHGLLTIALTGRGGEAGGRARVHVRVDEERTPRVQEVHRTVLHVICELVEKDLEHEPYKGHAGHESQ